jgi:hypothetical protein
MIRVVHPGSRIRMLTFYPSRIPDPGVKKEPDPGSGSATLLPNPILIQAEREQKEMSTEHSHTDDAAEKQNL